MRAVRTLSTNPTQLFSLVEGLARDQQGGSVNSAETLERADAGNKHVALKLETPDNERRIRRGMRLRVAAKRTGRALQHTVVGAALVAGGFCLGWKAFKFLH